MDSIVLSTLTTTPFRSPRDGWVPIPMIFTCGRPAASTPLTSPTFAEIFVVPPSSPTMMCSRLPMVLRSRGAPPLPAARRRDHRPAGKPQIHDSIARHPLRHVGMDGDIAPPLVGVLAPPDRPRRPVGGRPARPPRRRHVDDQTPAAEECGVGAPEPCEHAGRRRKT